MASVGHWADGQMLRQHQSTTRSSRHAVNRNDYLFLIYNSQIQVSRYHYYQYLV